MLIIGLVLVLLAILVPLPHILFVIGLIMLIIGGVLWLLDATGNRVGGRRWY